ncbi:hypothetical protein DT065_12335 [Salicibibacter kimchii]|uniref:Uncharacterized protein n=1 Tax=Salicibibacter kimchii TaxID=2099786 RepID=A0A345C0I8_9BACI|nr:hypothetical protein DT065_12335 [Salicibibacter kimchii]
MSGNPNRLLRRIKRLDEQASTLILITNVKNKSGLSDVDMLKDYKGQQVVESRLRKKTVKPTVYLHTIIAPR